MGVLLDRFIVQEDSDCTLIVFCPTLATHNYNSEINKQISIIQDQGSETRQ